jgi:hypothetical protein
VASNGWPKVHGVDAIDDRDVQPGVFDRVALDRVVLLTQPAGVDRVAVPPDRIEPVW